LVSLQRWICKIAIIGIGLLIRYMPKDEVDNSSLQYQFDFVGASLVFIAIACTLLGININPFLLIVAIIMVVLCKVWMTKSRHPFIDIELFKNAAFIRK